MREKVDAVIEALGVVAMSLMVLACLWQVFTRYVLGAPSGVTEEFMRYALIWTSLIGAPYAFGRGRHLAIVFLMNSLSSERRLTVRFIVDVCVLLFAVLVLIIGGLFVANNAVGQVSAALGLPMQYMYLAAPLSGVLFLFYLYVDFKKLRTEKAELASSGETIRTQSNPL